MKRIFVFLLTLCILMASAAFAADARSPLRIGGPIAMTGYWEAQGIPTDSPNYGWDDFGTIAQGDSAPDLYSFSPGSDDFLAAKNAGLFADLSGSAAIRAWTERLRPDMRSLVITEDGKIVGLAEWMYLLPMYWRQDAWDAAGLTEADMPGSYTELLDFLESWVERISEKPESAICIADTKGTSKNGYIHWLLDFLVNTWELQQYHAGETLVFDTPEFIALLTRTQDIGNRLEKAEPSEKKRQSMLPLFENYSGGALYNDGRDYGLSHTIPFRITADQPELMRVVARISVAREGSVWLSEIIGRLEDDLKDRSPIGLGNADLIRDVKPRVFDPKEVHSPKTVTAGYLSDWEAYAGILCFAPMNTFTMYEGALVKFRTGQLSAEALAEQISVPKRDPKK